MYCALTPFPLRSSGSEDRRCLLACVDISGAQLVPRWTRLRERSNCLGHFLNRCPVLLICCLAAQTHLAALADGGVPPFMPLLSSKPVIGLSVPFSFATLCLSFAASPPRLSLLPLPMVVFTCLSL